MFYEREDPIICDNGPVVRTKLSKSGTDEKRSYLIYVILIGYATDINDISGVN